MGRGLIESHPHLWLLFQNSENVELTFIKTQKESNSFYIAIFFIIVVCGTFTKKEKQVNKLMQIHKK